MTEQEMLQEALEWREHISKLASDYSDQELFRKRLATIEWLIEQAERVEELEKGIENLNELTDMQHEQNLRFHRQKFNGPFCPKCGNKV